MIPLQRRAAYLGAAIFGVALSAAACGGEEVVSKTEERLAHVPQDRATLQAVVEPVIEARFRDSIYYGVDCDAVQGTFVEWDVTGAAEDVIGTFKAAGWTARGSEGLDPMAADVHLMRDAACRRCRGRGVRPESVG